MEFENGQESMEFGFEQHPIGWYAFQILEGVKKMTKEGSQGVSIMIPMQSIKAWDKPKDGEPGDPGAIGGKTNHFVYLVKKDTGEKIKAAEGALLSLLTITDLIAKFRKQFPKGIELTDDKFIDQLMISLPGKFIRAEVTSRTDQNGNPQSQIKRWDRYGKKGRTPEPVAEEPETAGEDPGDGEDDWG